MLRNQRAYQFIYDWTKNRCAAAVGAWGGRMVGRAAVGLLGCLKKEQMSENALLQAAEAAMHRLLLSRHGREDFGISNAAAKLQAEAETRRAMTLMLGLIAAVSLLVGGIGVMNVMLMTVRERTREIGIRMATGARQRDILRQFLTEALLVTLVGGVAGVVIGVGVGAALIAAGVPVVFSLSFMAGAFACAVATGLVFGYMPARHAARLDPVTALGST